MHDNLNDSKIVGEGAVRSKTFEEANSNNLWRAVSCLFRNGDLQTTLTKIAMTRTLNYVLKGPGPLDVLEINDELWIMQRELVGLRQW